MSPVVVFYPLPPSAGVYNSHMKRFSILLQTIAITLILCACGASEPQSTPTINLAEKAPSSRQVPRIKPPSRPLIGDYIRPRSGNPLICRHSTFTPSAIYAGDPCINNLLPAPLDGKIKIALTTPRGTINVSVYLQRNGPQGVCGYRPYTIAAGGSLVIGILIVSVIQFGHGTPTRRIISW